MSELITDNARRLYEMRYLAPGETIDGLFDRVSGGNDDFRRLMAESKFLPNSPALFNLGLDNGCTSSACFVLYVEDTMGALPTDSSSSIVNTRAKAIAIAKAGGGVGYYFGDLRPKGSPIRSIHRKACGPVAVMRDYHGVHKLVTQGGKRDLAQMGVLPVWHDDIREFVHAKDEDPQSLSSFNISVSWPAAWVSDAFSQLGAAGNGKAKALWDEQCHSAWSHGCPGMMFTDRMNDQNGNVNPHLGLILASNPCGETGNRNDEPCLTADALIDTPDGLVPIGELPSDRPFAVNTDGNVRVDGCRAVSRGIKPTVRIMLSSGQSLRCTGNHKILTDGGWVEAGDLAIGDHVRVANVATTSPALGEVVSLEDGDEEEVFDILMPVRHHFLANGIVVHNCNLGSLNLWRFVRLKTREIDWDSLRCAARTALRFLDDILDRNTFPHPDITAAALLTRKLGLGVMGWADTLALLGIHYDTEEAVTLAGEVMSVIAEESLAESVRLAEEKGPYAGYCETRTLGPRARNETRTSIAPTGTIAILTNASSSIEPHYALEWERTTGEGVKLKERIPVWDLLDGFAPKTAHEIHWRWHVRHQAAFQAHTDLGCSKSINLPNSATVQDVSDAYKMMFDLFCKGGTVFRDGCRDEQVLTTKKTGSVFALGGLPHSKEKLPPERKSLTHKFRAGDTECFVTAGTFSDGRVAEIFLRASRLGSPVSGMLDSWAIAFSVALQHGTPLEELCGHHVGTRFEPCGLTGCAEIPVCTSVPDYVCRWLLLRFSKSGAPAVEGGVRCPDCGAGTNYQAGCLTCSAACGWTKCG
jgi:ribonucleotide reductase alpha subunit